MTITFNNLDELKSFAIKYLDMSSSYSENKKAEDDNKKSEDDNESEDYYTKCRSLIIKLMKDSSDQKTSEAIANALKLSGGEKLADVPKENLKDLYNRLQEV